MILFIIGLVICLEIGFLIFELSHVEKYVGYSKKKYKEFIANEKQKSKDKETK